MDLTYLGVLMVLHLRFGQNPPPVGGGLYGTCAIGKVSMKSFFLEVFPFPQVTLILVFVIVLFPPLVVFVPNLLLGS